MSETTIGADRETVRRLYVLAQADRRSMLAELRWLLDREEASRELNRAELQVRDEHTTSDCALPASSVPGVGAGR